MAYTWGTENNGTPADKPQDKDVQVQGKDAQDAPAGPEEDGSSTPGYLWDDHEAREAEETDARLATTETARREIEKDLQSEALDGPGASNRGRISTGGGAAKEALDQRTQQEKKDRENAERRVLLAMLANDADALADQFARDAEQHETYFRNKFGDAWAETLANKILDPDEFPEMQPGESIDDYRERVEQALIDEMIDPDTGQIKDEFRDHPDPDVARAAQWAQSRFKESEARGYARTLRDPNASPEEVRAAEQGATRTLETQRQTAQELVRDGTDNSHIAQATDTTHKQASAAMDETASGLGFRSGPTVG